MAGVYSYEFPMSILIYFYSQSKLYRNPYVVNLSIDLTYTTLLYLCPANPTRVKPLDNARHFTNLAVTWNYCVFITF